MQRLGSSLAVALLAAAGLVAAASGPLAAQTGHYCLARTTGNPQQGLTQGAARANAIAAWRGLIALTYGVPFANAANMRDPVFSCRSQTSMGLTSYRCSLTATPCNHPA